MKRFVGILSTLGLISSAVFAQTNSPTRPRVVTMPTQAPPVIQNDTRAKSGPPVLGGDNKTAQSPVPSQNDTAVEDGSEIIKVETNLITMPVSVLDREGRFVSGLQQSDFRIFENGVEQKVDYFQSVEQPFTVVLMIDVSPSTRFRMDQIQTAAYTFVNQLRPNDKVMVVSFDDTFRIHCRPTSDRRVLGRAINEAQVGDGTSLYEAVDQVVSQELQSIQGRKAVVLFTDGVDTTSRLATSDSTLAEIEEIDALFYPIRYNTQNDNFNGGWGGNPVPQQRRGGGGRRSGINLGDLIGIMIGGGQIPTGGGSRPQGSSNEYEIGHRYLESLAQNSGGRTFEADTIQNLDAAFSGIAEELRRQYSLGYYPEKVGVAGERKQMRVRVMRPNLVVRAKNSYIVGENNQRLAGR